MSPRRSLRLKSRRPIGNTKKGVLQGQKKVKIISAKRKHLAKQRGNLMKKSCNERISSLGQKRSFYSKKLGKKTNGMWNLGNTCWLNSIVHCFRAVPGFKNYLNQMLKDNEASTLDPEKLKTATALIETIESLEFQLRRSPRLNLPQCCVPFKLWTALKKPKTQQDTHEWLLWFMNCIAQVESSSVLDEKVTLTDFFVGSQISVLRCKNTQCKYERRNIERFQILSLGLKKVRRGTGKVMKLSNMVENYISIEKMGRCLECNKAGALTKRLVLDSLPLNLIFHLNRFEFDKQTCTIVKIGQKVEFPLDDFSITQAHKKYYLLAVVNHKGTIHGGHYTAIVREKGKWYLFDDECVTSVAKRNVVSKNAYILLYRKQD